MKATIWHNPRCSKSRAALALLQETPGVEVTVREYLKQRPTREELDRLFARAGITPRDALRTSEAIAREKALGDADGDTILGAMIADPILLERPIVETERGAVIARPAERVATIL